MPRLSPMSYRRARNAHPLLPLLLPECRSLDAARQELQWIRQELPLQQVGLACRARACHVPLQYILKSQPFGSLNIRCYPGVLIPRWETEEWTTRLIGNISACVARPSPLNVVDLCSGTGCIALLIKKQLQHSVNVTAVDCSPLAIKTIKQNMQLASVQLDNIQQLDVLDSLVNSNRIDILTCNPPYIPKINSASISTRLYEPKLALVSDLEFYQNLIDKWLPRTDSFVYELGQINQLQYVAQHIDPTIWSVGYKVDSNDKYRVVYGFKNSRKDLSKIFHGFGTLLRHGSVAGITR